MIRPALWLAVSLLASACYEFDGFAIASSLEPIIVGDTIRMMVLSRDADIPEPTEVDWSTSDDAIAVVDETGLVTGVGPGWVHINARSEDFSVQLLLRIWKTAPPFQSIHAGVSHTCGLAEDGQAWCWGSHEVGQLGTTSPPDRCLLSRNGPAIGCALGATPVETEVRFKELAAGYDHTCGVTADGVAHCWGADDAGQLADGAGTTRPTPTPVSGGHTFRTLSASGRITCGITMGDELVCWGQAGAGVLGASAAAVGVPTPVATSHRFSQVALAADHACGASVDGKTVCWGSNASGQLGVADVGTSCTSSGPPQCTAEPQEVLTPVPLRGHAVDRELSCGLAEDGSAYCWGGNGNGELGDGTTTGRWEPSEVVGGHSFSRLYAGSSRVCGLEGGLLYCWGRDGAGFGNGGRSVQLHEPTLAAQGGTFTTVSLGFGHSCAVGDDGVTRCWGGNLRAELGAGLAGPTTVTTPARVVNRVEGR